ncbi:hypothetical protein LUZ60_004039 [Juncus effusus]|nr:hypothetical protein LUZ60_004039 [Juncus effusus]
MNMTNPASLPPGFRFHPTDEELIVHYLKKRAGSAPCPVSIIAEVDIYKFNPWDLPAKAVFGDREWYFFTPRDRKYPNGIRPNRAAASGYWKATGTDKPIHRSNGNESIGVKKALVFYQGRPPKGLKTNWIMHEYRIAEPQSSNSYRPMKFKDASMRLDDWVLCRIYKKSTHQSPPQLTDPEQDDSGSEEICPSNYQNAPQMLNDPRLSKPFSLSEFLDYSNLSNFFDNSNEMLVPDQQVQFANGGNNMTQRNMQGGTPLSVVGESSFKRQREGDYSFNEGNNNIIDHGMQQNLIGQPLYGQGHILFGSNFGKN